MNPIKRTYCWIRDNVGAVGFLLALNCVVWTIIGVFIIYSYNHAANFAKCQAEYNQKSSVARDARVGVTDRETNLLFKALADNLTAAEKIQNAPADQQEAMTNRLQKRLLREFHKAVKAHDDRIQSAKDHPYPPNPETTCGTY